MYFSLPMLYLFRPKNEKKEDFFMDYIALLDLTAELGYQLAMSGAETFRVEESVTRIFKAYGADAEAFAIPNCLTVSMEAPNGTPVTRMRRIGHHGTDLDSVERFSNISRKICAEKPEPQEAMQWIQDAIQTPHKYPLSINLLGNILGATGFAFLFNGSIIDSLCAGFCGLLVGLMNRLMNRMRVNIFFSTIASAFTAALGAYLLGILGISRCMDAVIISALMLLVPGLLFTNALRDIIYGDTNSGINRIVQVLLIGVAIALGTGAAWNILVPFGVAKVVSVPAVNPVWLEAGASIIACLGFNILFNIHGHGGILCAIGGALAWTAYRLISQFSNDELMGYFVATIVAALYSEIMARVRKYPAISYLVVSVIPMLPGAGVYHTTRSIIGGDMAGFSDYGTQTIAIAGAIAVGILIISTLARLWGMRKITIKK